MRRLILIAAVADNGVIGDNSSGKFVIPWPRIPEDMKRFNDLTSGNVVIMGRNTYYSLPENYRPLPKRENVVLTRDPRLSIPGVRVCHSISDALSPYEEDERDVYFIGGRQVYEEALRIVPWLDITHVHTEPEGNVSFPKIDWDKLDIRYFKLGKEIIEGVRGYEFCRYKMS